MSISIQFLGAARQVTGSRHLVCVGDRRILLDCGMVQGPRRKANRAAVEEAFALDVDGSPIFTVISRLTWQKGMDALAEAVDGLVAAGGRLAVLGSGDRARAYAVAGAWARHAGRG